MNDDEEIEHTGDHAVYRLPQEIGDSELRNALVQLQLLGDDPYCQYTPRVCCNLVRDRTRIPQFPNLISQFRID